MIKWKLSLLFKELHLPYTEINSLSHELRGMSWIEIVDYLEKHKGFNPYILERVFEEELRIV